MTGGQRVKINCRDFICGHDVNLIRVKIYLRTILHFCMCKPFSFPVGHLHLNWKHNSPCSSGSSPILVIEKKQFEGY